MQILFIEKDNCLIDEVEDIFSLIKEYDAVLATGHLSLLEQHRIVRAAKEAGVKKILIQHADMGISKIPLTDQQYFASIGCLLEKCYLACSPDFHDLTVEEMAQTIDIIGHESCILVTDFGQPHNEAPVYALNRFIQELLLAGVKEEQVRRMLRENPQMLLGM
jgi:predicted metal-dependent TIM-barrel fold hydrolase